MNLMLPETVSANFVWSVYWIIVLIFGLKTMRSLTEASIEQFTTGQIQFLGPSISELGAIACFLIAIFSILKSIGLLDIIFASASPIIKYVLILSMCTAAFFFIDYCILKVKNKLPELVYFSQIIFASLLGYWTGEIAKNWGITAFQDAVICGAFSLLIMIVPLKTIVKVHYKRFDVKSYLQKLIERKNNLSESSSDYPKLVKEIENINIAIKIGKFLFYTSMVLFVFILFVATFKGAIFTDRLYLLVLFIFWYLTRYAIYTYDFPPKTIHSIFTSILFLFYITSAGWFIVNLGNMDFLIFLFISTLFGLFYERWNESILLDYPLLRDYYFAKYLGIINGMGYGKIISYIGIGISLIALNIITYQKFIEQFGNYYLILCAFSYAIGFYFIFKGIIFTFKLAKWMKNQVKKEVEKRGFKL